MRSWSARVRSSRAARPSAPSAVKPSETVRGCSTTVVAATAARMAALRGALRSLTAAAAAAAVTAGEGRIGQFHFGNEVHARASSMVFGRLAMNASHSAWSGWLSECDARFTLMFSSTLG